MANPAQQTDIDARRSRVILVDVQPDLAEKLTEALTPTFGVRQMEGVETLMTAAGLGTLDAAVIVLGTSAEAPIDVAKEIHEQFRQIQLLVLARGDGARQAQNLADMLNDGNDEIIVWDLDQPSGLVDAIKTAIKRASRRIAPNRMRERGEEVLAPPLTDAHEHLDRILEHAPIGMVTVEPDGTIQTLNKRARHILGIEHGQLMNVKIIEFVSVFDRKRLEQVLAGEAETDATGTEVFRIGNEETGLRHVEVTRAGTVSRPDKDCTMLILHDVTNIALAELAQKRTAAELQASEDRLHELAEVMRMVPWEARARDGRITYMGELVEEILGFPRERWLERGFWMERLHPDDRERAVKTINRNSRRLQNFDLEFRMIAQDGTVKWLRDIVNVVRDADGTPRKVRGFIVDISEEKQKSGD